MKPEINNRIQQENLKYLEIKQYTTKEFICKKNKKIFEGI